MKRSENSCDRLDKDFYKKLKNTNPVMPQKYIFCTFTRLMHNNNLVYHIRIE